MSKKNLSNKKSTQRQMRVPPSALIRLERQVLNDIRGENRRVQQPRRQRQNQSQGVMVAYAKSGNSSKPQIRNGDNSCRVVHRELITNLVAPAANPTVWGIATANEFPLQPGSNITFPWLSNMALNWERYRFNKLRFRYLPRLGTQNSGSVSLIPDYDAADAAPSNEMIASSLQNMKEDACWKEIVIDLDPKSLNALSPSKFTRFGNLASNLDIKTYDSGNLFIATSDVTTNSQALGKVWVEYDVTFMTPQLPPSGSQTSFMVNGGTTNQANPLGTAPVLKGGIGASVSGQTVTLTGLEPGVEYVATTHAAGTGITGVPHITALINGAQTLSAIGANVNGGATNSDSSDSFTATANTASYTLGNTTTTITGLEHWIVQAPSGLSF